MVLEIIAPRPLENTTRLRVMEYPKIEVSGVDGIN